MNEKPRKRVHAGGHHANFEPTEEQRQVVRQAAMWGINQEAILYKIINPATGHPIDVNTLTKYFRDELDKGADQVADQVANALYQSAVGRADTRAGIFLLKARKRWREDTSLEDDPEAKKTGGVLVVPATASLEEFEQLTAQHRQRIAGYEAEVEAEDGGDSKAP